MKRLKKWWFKLAGVDRFLIIALSIAVLLAILNIAWIRSTNFKEYQKAKGCFMRPF